MKSNKIIYDTVNNGEDAYFYGANTKDGFVLTPEARREESYRAAVYIKGGPGTGKSTLMRRFANTAVKIGYRVTYYYCSSDPSSLDAVVATRGEESVIVCDATSPHSADPVYPGAVSFVFDLSEFWDGGALASERDEIIAKTGEKRDLFERAYACLSAAGVVSSALSSLSGDCTEREKLAKFAERVAARHKGEGAVRRVILSSLSMKGAVRFDTLRERAKTVYSVSDRFGVSRTTLEAIKSALDRRGVGYTAAISPLDGSLEEILTGDETLYTIFSGGVNINADRFASSDAASHRSRIRFLGKCRMALVDEALSYLASASVPHFALEKIYSRTVNFDLADATFDRRIISLL